MKRRKIIKGMGILGAGLVGAPLIACKQRGNQPKPVATSSSQSRKLGVALVGLGGYSRGQLAPALQKTQHCELRGQIIF